MAQPLAASARPGSEAPAARTKLRLLKQPSTYTAQQVALAKRVAERPPPSPSPVSVMEIGAEAASTGSRVRIEGEMAPPKGL